MAIDLNNAQFGQFVRFAEQQANPVNSEAIACLAGGEDALAGRTIAASTTDRVRGWFTWRNHTADEKAMNNEVRALFRDAVYAMFGGAANLPESVKTQMRMTDYNCGKPLTARRIIAVRDAILQAMEKVDAKAMGSRKAGVLVDAAVAYVSNSLASSKVSKKQLQLDAAQRAQAVELVKTYGSGLTENCRKILANYVVTAIACGRHNKENRLDDLVSYLAGCLKNVRNFNPGDYRLAELDKQVTDYMHDSIADGQMIGQQRHYDEDGLFDTFKVDANRADFTIDGQHFAMNNGNTGPVTDKFKETIVSPQHRRVISSVMNQGLGMALNYTHVRDNLSPTTNFQELNLAGVKGAELMLTLPRENPVFEANGLIEHGTPKFVLSVEGDKARVTGHMPGNLIFNSKHAPHGWNTLSMGKIDSVLEFEFDLSDPDNAVLTSVHFGQTIDMAPPPEKE